MKIDLVKLDAHLLAAKFERPVDIAPGGRRRTGAMDIVRGNLDALQRRHDAGATWVEIAAALANQGVVQGNVAPITGKRLTALIASVRLQQAKRAAKAVLRSERGDVFVERPPVDAPARPLRLAKELIKGASPSMSFASPNVEDALRQENYEKYSKLFRKDSE